MGSGIPFLVIPLVVVLAALVIGVVVAKRVAQRQDEAQAHVTGPDASTLRYAVPEGQDPVAVVAALQLAGYEAVTDHDGNRQDVLVVCPDGVDRHRDPVRAAIESAPANLEGDPASRRVRFADE